MGQDGDQRADVLPGSGLNHLSCTWCWAPALSSFSQATGESQVLSLPVGCPVFIWIWGGDACWKTQKEQDNKPVISEGTAAVSPVPPLWHLTAPVLLQSLQKTQMLELSPEGCLSNILIKMINAIGPCWAFLTRNPLTFLTYCVVFQHKINFFFVQICLIAREERNGRLFTHYEVNS